MLVKDMKRLEALTHSTMVEYDQSFKGTRVPVPDAKRANNHDALPEYEIVPGDVKGKKKAQIGEARGSPERWE